MIRVIVADDHPLFREGVITSLTNSDDIVVVAEAGSAEETVRLVGDERPDVVLLDAGMPGGGLQAVSRIASDWPATRIVMLTVSDDEHTVASAMRGGASGYVLKGVSADELRGVVRSVYRGETYVPPALAVALRRPAPDPARSDPLAVLSRRERQVLELLAMGLSNQQIALKLARSEKSIKAHVTHILRKLQVRSRVEAALLGARLGLGRDDTQKP
jgi:two-component system, NarL family, nitrate/nitrite response regulator NarL